MKPPVSTLVDLLQRQSAQWPRRCVYTFLADGETEEFNLSYTELDRQARAIAATLQGLGAAGERALLLFPPGLEYIAGFFGCLYAGTVAVPAYPPDPARLNRTLPRLQSMLADAQATIVLTTSPILTMAEMLFDQAPGLGNLKWLATDCFPAGVEDIWHRPDVTPDTLAFLQYTSGSTRMPRGVMVSHGNLLHNLASITRSFAVTPDDMAMIWLPPYHDMGLIGGILEPAYVGMHCILMSPVSFLQRPFRWLQAVSRCQATISGGPNFAYDLCTRKITAEQRAMLDLGNWNVAFNGAEPVRPETLEQFARAFHGCGFRREAFYPCYGLAEATLIVTGGARTAPPVLQSVQKATLECNRVIQAGQDDADARILVGCGRSLADQQVLIVDPETHMPCEVDQVGEIWVSGPSVAQGYWNRPEETVQTFQAYLPSGQGPFLRTGDLGLLKDGELFITGRIKDLIIIRGRNHYPQDIELTVQDSHPALRPGCGAAFSVEGADGEGERLVVVQEVDARQSFDPDEIINSIRQAVAEAHEVQVHTVALIAPRSIPKTSSGKIQRQACKTEFLAGSLEAIKVDRLQGLVEHEQISLTRESLLSAEPGERQQLLESYLHEAAAQVLRVEPSAFGVEQPLVSLGLDSITAIELQAGIEAAFRVSLPLSNMLQNVTLSLLAAQVLAEISAAPAVALAPVAPSEFVAEYPCSHGQRALWFLQQLSPQTGAYNLAHAVRVRAEMDVHAMQRAFARIVERHPALRTTFAAPHGEPVQRVRERVEGYFKSEDASHWSDVGLDSRLAEEVRRPFDLERGPLVRMSVFSRSPHDHIMLLAMHHIVTDLWSAAVILSELSMFYQGEKAGVSVLPKPLRALYSDYIRKQAEMLKGPEGERLWAFWKSELARPVPALNLPTDRPRQPIQTYRGGSQTIRLSQELSRRLEAVAQAGRVTLYTVLLAAFQVLLYRYTGQDEFLVGTPKAGRTQEWSRLVGYFVNTVVLRANVAGDPTFLELLERASANVSAAFEHDTFPFALLVERLQPARDLSRSPLFQVMFAWQKTTHAVDRHGITALALGARGKALNMGGLMLEAYPLKERIVPFDLSLLMAESDGELIALMEYNADLFDGSTITRALGHLQILLESIAADPGRRVTSLPMLTEAERQQLLVAWNTSRTGDPPAPLVHRIFEAQAEQTPDAVALILGGERLTYRELNRKANQLARYLQKLGVGPQIRVCVCVERSVEMVVSLLGILKSGGAYLPLDPAYPSERLAFMLDDSQAAVLLTQHSLLEQLPACQAHIVCLDADWRAVGLESEANLDSDPAPEDLAYVIYTSGSTGKPKGVLISNRALADHCRDVRRHFGIEPGDRVLQFASLNFDASLEQILTTLMTGAQLFLRGPELLSGQDFNERVSNWSLTVVNVPPAYWHQWIRAWSENDGLSPNPQLRLVIIGGDVMLTESVLAWRMTPMGAVRLLNAYGPTETTITAMTFEVPPGVGDSGAQALKGERIPIGRPLSNRTAYILDGSGNPVPVGVAGELYIGGAGLAWGYLDRPELTAERFVPNPFSSDEWDVRLYKTGDLARYRTDGSIEFLGRLDNQVKIRGMRVEPGEIEAALNRCPSVREAVVVTADESRDHTGAEERRLVAYVVPREGRALTAGELQSFMHGRLPHYMIPSAFVLLQSLPLNVSGKVDRQALPKADLACAGFGTPHVAPRTPVEEQLARIWTQVLGVERVGIYDNFFELGGHSLLATQLASRLREAFHVELPLRSLFESPTVEGQAILLAQQQAAQAGDEGVDRLLAQLEKIPEDEALGMLKEGVLPD